MAGVVLVNEKRVEKPSESFSIEDEIRIKGETPESRYVGRGGLKLEHALKEFEIDTTGLRCIDIGSSTGGFTDCLLQHGASSVSAIDAGTNQLAWKLRSDPRVDVRENTNARYLEPKEFGHKFDLAVVDVSFISATKLLPAIDGLLTPNGRILVLVKPQFEVGKGEVGKGGIVRETEKHDSAVETVSACADRLGYRSGDVVESPITGARGNKEFFILLEKVADLRTKDDER